MPAYWNGIGGSVVFGSGVGSIEWSTIEWTLTETNRLWEASNSRTGGAATYRGGMNEYSGTFSIVWDSEQVPEVLGVAAGRGVTIHHQLGLSGMFYSQNAWVETYVPKLNTRTGGIEATYTWKGEGEILIDSLLLRAGFKEAADKREQEEKKKLKEMEDFRAEVRKKLQAQGGKEFAA